MMDVQGVRRAREELEDAIGLFTKWSKHSLVT